VIQDSFMSDLQPRVGFGDAESDMIVECIKYYRSNNQDPPYDGIYQKRFEEEFCKLIDQSGRAVAVCSGSAACYLAIKSLQLPKGSSVLLSPVSDTSSIMAILLADLKPIIVDTSPESYNSSLQQFSEAFSSDVSAIYLVHTYGTPADVVNISRYARSKKIKLIEDCSQSPFAYVNDNGEQRYVGTFGDVSAFSTMYRKTLHTCSSGGIVFTKSLEVYHKIIEFSDRGRKKWDNKFTARDIGSTEEISLNYNTNELSSAVGIASLARLKQTIHARLELACRLADGLNEYSKYLSPMKFNSGSSPFLFPVVFTDAGLRIKDVLFEQLKRDNIPFAPSYQCFAYTWPIAQRKIDSSLVSYIRRGFKRSIYSENATKLNKKVFNLFLHEGYTLGYIDYIVESFRSALS